MIIPTKNKNIVVYLLLNKNKSIFIQFYISLYSFSLCFRVDGFLVYSVFLFVSFFFSVGVIYYIL